MDNMASNEWNPTSTDIRHTNMSDAYINNSADEGHLGHRDESVERPAIMPARSSTDNEDEEQYLERVQTTQSMRDRRVFQPILQGDREQLQRMASGFGEEMNLSRTKTRESSALERIDTLAGVNLGDPVLDPNSPEFDVYKWSRMYVILTCVEKGQVSGQG
jgi:ATP-binding cassette subfamily G (WHITE) protein 2 (PDR)